jgi:hypothetical protein
VTAKIFTLEDRVTSRTATVPKAAKARPRKPTLSASEEDATLIKMIAAGETVKFGRAVPEDEILKRYLDLVRAKMKADLDALGSKR